MEIRKGKLKIFFGYCAGVGKTYAMLQEAQQKSVEGTDVVAGYIEPHERKETSDLIYGLECLPTKPIVYKHHTLHEFDVDGALKRHPQLILVDELAHTNAPSSRHEKRYSDIEELLRAGIDVYTTVNVQHLESLHDIIESITHIQVSERIPDHLFDEANDVKLVDIEVDELMERLTNGKIYAKNKINSALQHFFMKENLIALRSIALRRCAERVNLITSSHNRAYIKEHILVCLGTSPTNEKVLRTAARMVQAFHGDFTALYVETKELTQLPEKAKQQLEINLKLARHLGAAIVSTYGEDVAYQISQYAKTASVSKLVLGRSYQQPTFFHRQTLVDQLTKITPDLEIYIIPDVHSEKQTTSYKKTTSYPLKEGLITLLILLITTLLGCLLYALTLNPTNCILLFVLAACLIGACTIHPLNSILSALYSIAIINFLFIEPRFTFHMNSSQYTLIFLCMLIVSLTISSVTRKLKKENNLIALHAHSMDVLLETSQKLQGCTTPHDIQMETCYQLQRMLQRQILYYPIQDHHLQDAFFYGNTLTKQEKESYTSLEERAVAKWVLENNKNAGASTSTLPNAKALYLAIRKNDDIFAIIAIAMNPHESLPPYEKGLLKAMLNEIALTMDSMKQKQLYKETILQSKWFEAMEQEDH